MKENLTEMVFILDKSGSMAGLEADTMGGYNAMIKKQKAEQGEAIVTTVLFDDKYELLHDRTNLKDIKPMTSKDYFVEGSTALLDAIGKTIQKIGRSLEATDETKRPSKVVFIITTDGQENASCEYSYETIRNMVELQKSTYQWEFVFIGANIDAIATAAKFGIAEDRASNYVADSKGTELNYEAVCSAVSSLRKGKPIERSWKRSLEMDYEERQQK